jgi:hypothetical protein
MSKLPKYAAKRDMNEKRIVEALRMVPGVTVVHLNAPGLPDLLVGRNGVNYLMEIKTPRGKLTEPEQDFFERWNGQCAVVRSVDDAQLVIGVNG